MRIPPTLAFAMTTSGASALAYEVAWTRRLEWSLGNVAWAQAAAISAFMLWMGLGYVHAHRASTRVGQPSAARRYALLEVVVAVIGVVMPFGVDLVEFAGALTGGGAGPSPVEVALSLVLLCPPALAMGMTLPYAARAVDATEDQFSAVYGFNTLGAALGAAAAGPLLGVIGLRGVESAAIGMNLLAAVAGWFLAGSPLIRGDALPEEDRVPGDVTPRGAIVIAFAVGAGALALEMLALRYAAILFGSSAWALSMVLSAFVIGNAIGALVFAPRLRLFMGVRATGAVALGMLSITLGLLQYLAPRAPNVVAAGRLILPATSLGFAGSTAMQWGLSFLFLVPFTIFSGAALPLLAGHSRRVDRFGPTLAANAVGSALGAAVCVPLFVPTLGLQSTMTFVGLLAGVSAIALALRVWRNMSETGRLAFGVAVIGVAFALTTRPWDLRKVHRGVFRSQTQAAAIAADPMKLRVWGKQDGALASVVVIADGPHRTLRINGKSDASTRGDKLTQLLSGVIPDAYAPPGEALVIGLGSGMTAGAIADLGRTTTVVEVEPAVIGLARAFDELANFVLDREEVRLIRGDGARFLRHDGRSYALIVSEPSNPWLRGNAGLFSRQYFESARGRLAPDGIFAQWFHLYEMTDEGARDVMATLASVFPHVRVWQPYPEDLLFVASTSPLRPDLGRLAAALDTPHLGRVLRSLDIGDFSALLSLECMSEQRFQEAARGGHVQDVMRPSLETTGPAAVFLGRHAYDVAALDERRGEFAGHVQGLLLGDHLTRHPPSVEEASRLFRMHTRYPAAGVQFRSGWADQILGESTDLDYMAEFAGSLLASRDFERATRAADRLVMLGGDPAHAAFIHARVTIMSHGDRDLASAQFDRCLTSTGELGVACRRWSEACRDNSYSSRCVNLVSDAFKR